VDVCPFWINAPLWAVDDCDHDERCTMSTHAEAPPAPAGELRTALGLVTLAAALAQVMGASHAQGGVFPAGLPFLAMALVQGVAAASIGFTRARSVLAPAAALNVVIALAWIVTRVQGLPITPSDLVATACELVAAGATVALLRGIAPSAVAKVALLVFVAAAFSGFGHVGH
jgi:hypothetical protein